MPRQIYEVVDLWLACRRAGAMKATALPCIGGVGDQPAALMDAFAFLDDMIGKDG